MKRSYPAFEAAKEPGAEGSPHRSATRAAGSRPTATSCYANVDSPSNSGLTRAFNPKREANPEVPAKSSFSEENSNWRARSHATASGRLLSMGI